MTLSLLPFTGPVDTNAMPLSPYHCCRSQAPLILTPCPYHPITVAVHRPPLFLIAPRAWKGTYSDGNSIHLNSFYGSAHSLGYMRDLGFRYITCAAVVGIVYWPSNPCLAIIYNTGPRGWGGPPPFFFSFFFFSTTPLPPLPPLYTLHRV